MIRRNPHFLKLKPHYLFQEIQIKKREHQEKNPKAQLIHLGIGDTTEPLPPSVVEALGTAAKHLGTKENYRGYGPEQGLIALREAISQKIYRGKLSPQDIFVSDGAKCDIGRLQLLFGEGMRVAVQDPVYPVYFDGSLLHGAAEIIAMPCVPENGFFPDLDQLPPVDILYFCSPNNPTGSVASYAQLKQLVDYARREKCLIIFDAAYAPFVQGEEIPRSIYEIPGAEEVAIEVHSFSKLIGFTGVRLGWTVVPEKLCYANGESIRGDWNRLVTTLFNGASYIAQHGGIAALSEKGLGASQNMVTYYLDNGKLLKEALEKNGYEVHGGEHAPYLWVKGKGESSWDLFHHFLEAYQVIVTPGSGFGVQGEGFVRMTSFNTRDNIEQAISRMAAPIVE